jgi:hypothetical protein
LAVAPGYVIREMADARVVPNPAVSGYFIDNMLIFLLETIKK